MLVAGQALEDGAQRPLLVNDPRTHGFAELPDLVLDQGVVHGPGDAVDVPAQAVAQDQGDPFPVAEMGGKNDHAPLFFQGPLQDLGVVDAASGPGSAAGSRRAKVRSDLHEYPAEMIVDAVFQVGPARGAVSGKGQGQVGGDQARVPGAGLF